MQLTRHERLAAAMDAREVDRAPVSAWGHFLDREQDAASLAAAMIGLQREFDWDFLKINPRATCFAEAWGNRYDVTRYVSVVPTPVHVILNSARDLASIQPVDPSAGALGEQLEVVERVARELGGEVPLVQTVFSPLSVLTFLTGGNGGWPGPSGVDGVALVRQFSEQDAAAVHGALDAVTRSLSAYAQAVVAAGASGVFFAIVRLACAAAFTRDEYAQLGAPYDRRVLESSPGLTILHLCGEHTYFAEVADYPARAINFHARAPGNPSLSEAHTMTHAAVMGGAAVVDDAVAVANSVHAALDETHGRGIVVSPACTIDPVATPAPSLHALRAATESWTLR